MVANATITHQKGRTRLDLNTKYIYWVLICQSKVFSLSEIKIGACDGCISVSIPKRYNYFNY